MSVGRHVYSVQRWFWVREMADPMTNMEIEDVLSSIRRLVSEDLRPGFRAESPVEPAALAGDEGKLVLTPAFRVADAPPVAKPDQAQVWRRAASRRIDDSTSSISIFVIGSAISRTQNHRCTE